MIGFAILVVAALTLWGLTRITSNQVRLHSPRATSQLTPRKVGSNDGSSRVAVESHRQDKTPTPRSVFVVEPSSGRREISARYLLDDLFVSPVDQSLIGVSFSRHQLLIGPLSQPRPYPFKAIMSVEVLRNGITITQTNRGSQLLGAAVGAAAFGGVGALAGALTGSTRSKERLTDLTLKLILDEPLAPIHIVRVLMKKRGKGLNPSSGEASAIIGIAERLNGQIMIAMRRAASSAEIGQNYVDAHPTSAEAAEWDARASVHIINWNGKAPILFLTALREFFSPEEVLRIGKARKAPTCVIKVPTPADAERLASLFASYGVSAQVATAPIPPALDPTL